MYLDDPGHRLYEDVVATHFGNHPLSMSVLGPAETIRGLQREEVEAYFRQRYGPGNMVVAVTGRFDFDKMVRLVDHYCGHWPQVRADRQQPSPMHKPQRKSLSDPKLKRTYTMAMAPAPGATDPRRFAARVLADVVGDSEGSRFYWALVDPAIAEEAYFDYQPFDDCGSYFISLAAPPERTEQALAIALAELEKVKQDLTDDEVERAKNKIASSIVLQGEVPIGRMQAIGRQWIYNKEYRSLERDTQTLMAITPRQVHRLIEEFPFAPMTIATLGPGK
jgi:predicted Zn-dependent peptidase